MVDLAFIFVSVVIDSQDVSTRQESNHSERESSHESEPDLSTQPRPAISSGYLKPFQKSLPPRFQRQQVVKMLVVLLPSGGLKFKFKKCPCEVLVCLLCLRLKNPLDCVVACTPAGY